ncbi:MAG: DUF3102 domain-containing protein [Phycisphaerales bacterium]|nr:MAG: DUF3102 domain-containing protein [Phycisphaerales bacterium]
MNSDTVLANLADKINDAHRKADKSRREAIAQAELVGRLLNEAKAECGHGNWSEWVRANCEFGERMARNYMALAETLPQMPAANRKRVADMSLRRTFNEVTKVRAAQRREEEKSAAAETHQTGGDIITGDMGLLYDKLEDDSVDMVLTDPPYTDEGVKDNPYGRLAELALAKLKPGGLCLAYCGIYHLQQCWNAMAVHLSEFWLFGIQHTGGFQQMWARRVMNRWKPIIVMAKPPLVQPEEWVIDFHKGGGRDKQFHEWGQHAQEVTLWIEKLTPAGGLVVDPFCGGGAIPAACKAPGRRWLATEIDADTTAVARKRLDDTMETAA